MYGALLTARAPWRARRTTLRRDGEARKRRPRELNALEREADPSVAPHGTAALLRGLEPPLLGGLDRGLVEVLARPALDPDLERLSRLGDEHAKHHDAANAL